MSESISERCKKNEEVLSRGKADVNARAERGSSVTREGVYQTTALYWAANKGNVDIVAALLPESFHQYDTINVVNDNIEVVFS